MDLNLKNMVIDQKKVTFSFYRHGELWYTTECGFEFPVPISDVGDAVFLKEDKAILFMRWIRPHIERMKEGMAECSVQEDDDVEDCPYCGEHTVKAKSMSAGGGVECTNPDCDYWFCF